MKTYELTYIASSNLGAEGANKEAKEVESLIKNKEGVVLASQTPSIRTMSYLIKRQGEGYFCNLTFKIEEDKIKDIKEKLEKNSNILRHLIIVKMPFREMKEKRTRRPLIFKEKQDVFKSPLSKDKKSEEKVDVADLNKKLDEILKE